MAAERAGSSHGRSSSRGSRQGDGRHGSGMLIHATDFEDETAVQKFIERLEQERTQYEEAGKYLEAERCHEKIKELERDAARRSKEALLARHSAELLAVQDAYYVEKMQFEALWQQKEQEYEETTKRLKEAMEERHELERAAHLEELHQRFPFRPKYSKALIQMRSSEKHLVKLKRYQDAMKQKLHADNKEREEKHDQRVEYEIRCQNMQGKLLSRQEAELDALLYRIESGRKEQRRIRAQDLERITQRFSNIRADVESGHKIELMRVQKMVAHDKGATSTGPTSIRSRRRIGGKKKKRTKAIAARAY